MKHEVILLDDDDYNLDDDIAPEYDFAELRRRAKAEGREYRGIASKNCITNRSSSMATPQDAELIIKLYDLRRDETMRKARHFLIFEFFPQSGADVQALFADRERPERSAYFRQVTSYWDMAAAMVNHGSIDRELFFDTNGEFLAVWIKVGHLIEDLRGIFGPQYLVNLERLVAQYPNVEQRLELLRARFKAIAERQARQ